MNGVRSVIILGILLLIVVLSRPSIVAHALFLVAAVMFALWTTGLIVGRGKGSAKHRLLDGDCGYRKLKERSQSWA